jgi:hypothetical protein
VVLTAIVVGIGLVYVQAQGRAARRGLGPRGAVTAEAGE